MIKKDEYPTASLRFVVRHTPLAGSFFGHVRVRKQRILQQLWVIQNPFSGSTHEWRDVPTVLESSPDGK